MRPLFARVLLKRQKAEKIGNILIPQSAAKMHATLRCEVVAVGPTSDESIIPGQEVIIGTHTGVWVNAGGKVQAGEGDAEFFIVQDEDILAVVKESDYDRGNTAAGGEPVCPTRADPHRAAA